ncbi:hypothetical protein B9Z55_017226 [Caenorhabditis nigoni]|uniref:DUF281 domain-containing protein n=1 Tax=Caenorhabditis nigoni TaxID=1611254 RepID=A0A2G5T8J1_9PELO|nr:hypothetical protein B9Z55_017226 [Caenorhabditis nigoni]
MIFHSNANVLSSRNISFFDQNDQGPITVAPVTDGPVTNSPVTDGPVTDAPITEAPVTDAPVTDAPVEPDPCANCDATAIQPTPTDAAVIFSIQPVEAPGECVGEIVCERTDGKVCNTAGVSAIIPIEQNPVSITDKSTTNSASSTIKCSKDGTISHLTTTGITKLVCDFAMCALPCEKCNVLGLFPNSAMPGTITYPSILSGPGECTKLEAFCERTDGQTCTNIIVYAVTSVPDPLDITDTLTASYGSSPLECANDGTFTYTNGLTGFTLPGITEIQCVFIGC